MIASSCKHNTVKQYRENKWKKKKKNEKRLDNNLILIYFIVKIKTKLTKAFLQLTNPIIKKVSHIQSYLKISIIDSRSIKCFNTLNGEKLYSHFFF